MAEVRLQLIDGRVPPLPAVCIRCGRPADGVRNVRLSVASFSLRRPKIAMPICTAHRFLASSALLVVLSSVGVLYAVCTLLDFRYGPLVFMGGVVIALALGYELETLGVRGRADGPDTLVVSGVSSGFADALGRMPVCRRCAYDLTGNVSGVCPECGAPVPR